MVGLNSEVMDISSQGILWWLVIEVKASIADFYKHVSFASKFCIKDNLPPKKLFVELDALIDIRRKNMDMMNVTNQIQFSFCERPSFITFINTNFHVIAF